MPGAHGADYHGGYVTKQCEHCGGSGHVAPIWLTVIKVIAVLSVIAGIVYGCYWALSNLTIPDWHMPEWMSTTVLLWIGYVCLYAFGLFCGVYSMTKNGYGETEEQQGAASWMWVVVLFMVPMLLNAEPSGWLFYVAMLAQVIYCLIAAFIWLGSRMTK